MKKTSEYRRHAEECRQLMAMAVSQDQRATLENMARTWEALAADRERLIDRGKRISELESDPNSKR